MQNSSVVSKYQEQIEKLTLDIKILSSQINQYAYLRLIVFALAITFTYLFFDGGLTYISAIWVIAIIAFLYLVKIYVKKQNELQFQNNKLLLLENECNSLLKKENIYSDGSQFMDAYHPYTDDLDIFGAHSLYHYVNRSITLEGQELLANWFKKPTNQDDILLRQQASLELQDYQSQSLDFRAKLYPLNHQDLIKIKHFIAQVLPKEIGFMEQSFIKILIWLTPMLNFSVLALAIIFNGVWWSILALCLILIGIAYFFFKKKIDSIHNQADGCANVLNSYAQNINWIESNLWKSDLLNEIKKSIETNQKPLYQEIDSLSQIIKRLDNRLNPIVGIFLNLFLQWDLRCLTQLHVWEKANQTKVLKGFDVIAHFETLISFSIFNINHPDYVFPLIAKQYSFKSKKIGHPLIPVDTCVKNNFELENQITVDIVTGSNMAGKSTFLRTVGINMVMAFAGMKVCATQLETSIFNIVSYMRIKDSLANQTSTFKAEIDRLKMIIDFTQENESSFVLIDEMLRGTNSKDKYLGTKAFIQKLIKEQIPGFIATHDLQIAELETDHPKAVRNFHFDITLNNQEMFFDYQIKMGECKNFNAAILLKAIGIG
jgi:DNA mismatch repair ATPase MutS